MNHSLIRRLVPLILIGFIAFANAGCTIAKISGRGATPILLNNPDRRVEVIEHFKVSKGIYFDFTGSYDASEILGKVMQETQCDAVINVNFTIKQTFGDFWVTLFTLGLANAKHIVVTGDAVRYKKTDLGATDPSKVEVVSESGDLKVLTTILLGMSEMERSSYSIVRSGEKYQLQKLSLAQGS